MGAPEGTEGLLFGFPSLHCILLLGFWPLGLPVRSGAVGQDWSGWLQGLHTETEAGGSGTAWLSLWVICGNEVLSRELQVVLGLFMADLLGMY